MKKLVVVTGASSGIGMECAKKFSKEGHPVLMLARRKEIMQSLNLENSICESVDVTDYNAMEQAIKKAEEKYGKVDLLINNAGVMLLGRAEKQDYKEWQQMVDVNIKGILTGTNIVLKDMMQQKHGTIINISSTAGRKTYDNHSVYCGTKFAVHAITESMRKEASAHNVRVLVVAPGVVETALLSHTTDKEIVDNYNLWKKEIDGGLSPETVAECIYFAYNMPQNISLREIVLTKTNQAD